MLADENPQFNKLPRTLGGVASKICLMVADADATFRRAVEAGAEPTMEPADMFYGFRNAALRDPAGHEWMIQHRIQDIGPEEMQAAWEKMLAECPADCFPGTQSIPSNTGTAHAGKVARMTTTTNSGPTNSGTVLVIGGTGKTGRRLAERLRESGRGFRIGSRHADPPFDWDAPATWGPAIEGMTAAYVTYQPDLAVPGGLATVREFFARALDAGVKKIVLLSGRGEEEAEAAEQALQATDADWTILRASWFFQNFSESFFLDPIVAGEVALPVSTVAEPFVDCEDIADIAFAALTTGDHSHKLYELTGPRALTFQEVTDQIARATGRQIGFVSVTPDEYRAGMEQAGVPAEYANLVTYLFTTVLDGRNTPTADGVQQALGRAPRDFSDFVRETESSGIWYAAE